MDKKTALAKEAYVESLFSAIARRYDFFNNVLSLTRHGAWRRFAVSKSGVKRGACALDVCCGTGDFAFELARAVGSEGHVTGVDFSTAMIEIARIKSQRLDMGEVEFIVGNARDLPFDDASFDCVTIGFGLRNLADAHEGIAEMARVIKPGGRLVCLEINKVRSKLLSPLWKLYFYGLAPYLAMLFRGNRGAYKYLPESVKTFMSREEISTEFELCGLTDVKYYDLMFGAVCVHVGTRAGALE